jgi:hypothetical protein
MMAFGTGRKRIGDMGSAPWQLKKFRKTLEIARNRLELSPPDEVTVLSRGRHVGVPPVQLRTTTKELGDEQEAREDDHER